MCTQLLVMLPPYLKEMPTQTGRDLQLPCEMGSQELQAHRESGLCDFPLGTIFENLPLR